MKRPATATRPDGHHPGFAAAGLLVVAAFAGAATAGTLSTVGPYLLGISGLVGLLFLVGRRAR